MTMEKAEKLKNKGNDELKKGNVGAAIACYTEALGNHNIFYFILSIESHISEAIYTNRAAAYI